MEFFNVINPIAWVLANMMLAYTSLALIVFVIMYYALFDPKATTGGKLIFRFMLSLVGVIVLSFLGVFIDPAPDRQWTTYPEYIDWWRPLLRLFVYGYVAFTITSLAVLLIKRKWFPGQLIIAPSHELVKLRHETSEIPIVESNSGDSDETK